MSKIDDIEREMEITLESDPRTMTNRIHEYGWLFDKILKWKRMLSEIEMEDKNDNNN